MFLGHGSIKSPKLVSRPLRHFREVLTLRLGALAIIICAAQLQLGEGQRPTASGDCQLVQRAATIYLQVGKTGVARHDIERFFKEDGGLQVEAPVRYVFKECNFIKMDVTFAPSQDRDREDDKVDHASKLYIEFPVMD